MSATPASNRLQLQLQSREEALDGVVEQVHTFLENRGFDEDCVYRTMLIVSEAVTNAIKHGNRYDAGKKVGLDVTIDPDAITVAVDDEGNGFTPVETPDPLAGENLLKTSGRGIFLMRSMADEVRHENGGRRVIATIRT